MTIKFRGLTKKIKEEKAYTTLISVIIVGAIGTATALSLILSSLNSSQTSFTYVQSSEARNIANASAEAALQQIQSSPSYEGNDTLTIGNGTGSYTVVNLGGQSREIQATATVNSVISKIKIQINQVTPNINVSSWVEVAVF